MIAFGRGLSRRYDNILSSYFKRRQLVTISFQVPLLSYSILHLAGTPGRIRTDTRRSLNPLPLPIGLQGHVWQRGWDSNPRGLRPPVFETGTIDHSDTSPEKYPASEEPRLQPIHLFLVLQADSYFRLRNRKPDELGHWYTRRDSNSH